MPNERIATKFELLLNERGGNEVGREGFWKMAQFRLKLMIRKRAAPSRLISTIRH